MPSILPPGEADSVSWSIPTPEECCSSQAHGGFSYDMCLALCMLCCATIKITYKQTTRAETAGVGDGGVTPADDPRDQPEQTVTDNGISFTTSSYGKFIPIVFGSDKLTGNVIWASPIRTETYATNQTYRTVDFALGICEGEINGVMRGWVGDKLILDFTMNTDGSGNVTPNADGYVAGAVIDLTDEKSPLRSLRAETRQTRVSVFAGSETQVPEGIMADTEGYESTPAYRGTAYILFENWIIADSQIPDISVEVSSNTDTLYPRLTGTVPSPKTRFNTISTTVLAVDPSYGRVYVRGVENQGTGTIPNSNGVIVFDYNRLDVVDEFDVKTTLAPAGSDSNEYFLAPQSSKLFHNRASDNAGYNHLINPFSHSIDSTLGPGGSLSTHSLTTGFAVLGGGTVVFPATDTNGLVTDVICGVGVANQSVAFAAISDTGQLVMRSTFNNVLTKTSYHSKPMRVTSSTATFVDGAEAIGTHVLVFGEAASETTNFKVTRFTIDSAPVGATITTPVMTEMGTISVDEFGGVGFAHSISDVLYNAPDNTFILIVTAGASRGPFIAKWSPFTGQIVWKAVVSYPSTAPTKNVNAVLTNEEYSWISGTKIYSINLKTGVVRTVVENLTAQSLPALSGNAQYYNPDENSILYVSTDPAQLLVKVFTNRITRATVDLKDIILSLLKRVGMLNTDILATDLNAITLNGYTITSRKTLRSIFSELAQVFLYDVIESNGRIAYKTRGEASIETIPHEDLSMVSEDGWLDARDSTDISKLRKINLTYRDIDREYRDNVQSLLLPKSDSAIFDNDAAIDVSVPIVLTADDAKALAEILLYAKLTYGTTYSGTLPQSYLAYDPGDVVTVELNAAGTNTATVRLRNVKISPQHEVSFDAVEEDPDIYNDAIDLFSNVGRYEKSGFPAPEPRIDPVVLTLTYRDEDEMLGYPTSFMAFIAFLNVHPDAAFKREPAIKIDNAAPVLMQGPFAFPTWGYVTTPLSNDVPLYSTDTTSAMRVRMTNTTGAALASSTLDGIIGSDKVNLALVGKELIQFATVTSLGDGFYEFSVINRAKLGTDVYARSHVKGERFILLSDNLGVMDTSGVKVWPIPAQANQKFAIQVLMRTQNPYQINPIQVYTGLNLSPWTVANLAASYSAGDALITWNHRNRYGGEWPDDGSEALPVVEATTSFDIFLFTNPSTFNVRDSSTYLRKVTQSAESFTYTTTMQTADGFDRSTTDLFIRVVQNGTAAGNGGIVNNLKLAHL